MINLSKVSQFFMRFPLIFSHFWHQNYENDEMEVKFLFFW
jgi:hypothetical protein